MTLANRDLAAAGITSPTPQQTEAALMGGTVTNGQGQTTEMAGVLQLRGQGMGWGQVAHAVGVHPAQSEQGASRSMRGAGSEQRIAGLSASQSSALSRDSTPALGSSATSVSGDANRTDLRGSTAGDMTRDGGHRDPGSSVAAGAASQSSLRGRDSGSSAIAAAAGQASLSDRGSSVSAAGTFRGKEPGNDARTASAAVAGASISDRGKDRGPAVRAGIGSDSSTGIGNGSRDKGQGKGKKH